MALYREKIPNTLVNSLPLGWLCAAHSPNPPSKITAKHRIMDTFSIKTPPEDRSHPAYCSRAEHGDVHCDLSLVVMNIEELGLTCLVQSAETVQIDFYCDCCDPSLPSVELPRGLPWLSRYWYPQNNGSFSDLGPIESLDEITARIRKGFRERGELRRRSDRRKKQSLFESLSSSDSESDEEYWTPPSSPKECPYL